MSSSTAAGTPSPARASPGPVEVRPATPDDVPTILRFIKDLAEYEKEPDAVKATEETLHQSIFVDKYAHVVIAFSSPSPPTPSQATTPVGMALYFFTFSTWTGQPTLFLEDLYVDPAYRNGGIGKRLFAELGKIAKEKGAQRVDWNVLKWNEPSIAFYTKALKAVPLTEWQGMRLEGDDAISRLCALA